MWRGSRILCQVVGGGGGAKIPHPGSSLLNPRSQRAKTRRALSMHQQQQAHFEEQALFADVGGSGDAGVKRRGLRRRLASETGSGGKKKSTLQSPAKNNAQRKSFHVRRVGQAVAEQAKHMTDSEWESVSLEDKHAFTKYMSQVLKTHPTTVSEQQRRRFFETTMMDPRDLDPNRTVQDEYERVKLGLPVQLKNPQRSLGVSQAIYETGDASLFDPDKVYELENAMTDVKQVFADYIRKRREGISTEAERRQLAHLTADLNTETQKHLAHLFKYSEERLRAIAREERKQQLEEIQRLRRLALVRQSAKTNESDVRDSHDENHQTTPVSAAEDKGASTTTSPAQSSTTEAPSHTQTRSPARASRKAALKASIRKAIGLDVDVVDSILAEMEAQEQFFQFCEVFARLTVGRGFEHTTADESLDAYTESLKKLYSVDAESLSTLDVVQYMAAKDQAAPVEWAKRWYERAIMVPLQRTPEYQRLRAIQESDVAALKLRREAEKAAEEADNVAHEVEKGAARYKTEKVTRIVEKMFMRPDDARLQSLHEKRLRYLAYLQMERQIEKARQNAERFAGIEDTAEAVQCRAWYQQILARKAALEVPQPAQHQTSPDHAEKTAEGDEVVKPNTDTAVVATDGSAAATVNIFEQDPEAAALFEKIRDVAIDIIQQERQQRRATEAAAKAARVRTALKDALGGEAMEAAQTFQRVLDEKKRAMAQRLLGIMERDVTSEVQWLEEMEEADRPPLLPIPDAMSYVSAADVQAWQDVREASEKDAGNPFKKNKAAGARGNGLEASLFGQPWRVPDKPMLFWGTGTRAVQQALQFAAEDADRKRRGEPLAPPYPCPENPWGWRLVKDILDD